MNVRFEGNSGHDTDVKRCLLMTQSGLSAGPHSILDTANSAGPLADEEGPSITIGVRLRSNDLDFRVRGGRSMVRNIGCEP